MGIRPGATPLPWGGARSDGDHLAAFGDRSVPTELRSEVGIVANANQPGESEPRTTSQSRTLQAAA